MAGPTKGRADHLVLGDWNAECSICGFKRKASSMVKNWQGWYRCPEHNEPRQPQDFVRGEPDVQTVPWAQPPTAIFVQICTLEGISAFPGLGEPGCMIPGIPYTSQFVNPLNPPPPPPPPPPTSDWITEKGDFWVTENGDFWSLI